MELTIATATDDKSSIWQSVSSCYRLPLLSVLFGLMPISTAAEKALPENAHEHAAGPAHFRAPQPELNPWAHQGIAAKHVFGALYTRKHYEGEKWHEISRTGEYADVVVRFDDSRLQVLFGRISSYHPEILLGEETVVAFPERITRRGNGPERRPDKVNHYARARVVESNSKQVLIHYRYMPVMPDRGKVSRLNPPDQTTFVDEYFLFFPDRTGLRASRPGSAQIESWRDSSRLQVTSFRIGRDGVVSEGKVTDGQRRRMLNLVGFEGAPQAKTTAAPRRTRPENHPEPILAWAFDEGEAREVREAISGMSSPIQGNAAIWRRGVSGHALLFDGVTSVIEHRGTESIEAEQLTLSAWVCLAAYPWNDCSVIQQGNVLTDGKGLALGVGPDGEPLMALKTSRGRIMLRAQPETDRIPRFQWAQLTGVIDLEAGHARLYLDSRKVAEAEFKADRMEWASEEPLKIGQGPPLEAAWPVGRLYGAYPYSFEGLIDEVLIYDQVLEPDTAAIAELRKREPDMPRRVLPAGDEAWKEFGAHYTRLRYHESWDSLFRMSGHPDIVVTFDKFPGRYVFWHGVNYVPMMVNEKGHWYSNEFNETWWNGGYEPMADKRVLYGRVDVIEQSEARVVVRWRYPLSNVNYQTYAEGWADSSGWGEWSDWYFTIYPDGSCVKRMRSWMSVSHPREWHESMVILGPDQHPETVIENRSTLTLGTLDGTLRKYDWIEEPPTNVDYSDVSLHLINLKAQYDPYSICPTVTRGNVYTRRGENPYGVFPAWNHWPVGQFASCGRYVRYPDRAAHCSMTHLYWDPNIPFGQQGCFEEKLMLEGLSNESPERMIKRARSYLTPPAATVKDNRVDVQWDASAGAYSLTRGSGAVRDMTLVLDASEKQPAVNPVFVVENWGDGGLAEIRINEAAPPADFDIRQGLIRRPNGVSALVVWIEMTCLQSTSFKISMSR